MKGSKLNRTKIYAHRGASVEYPENTLAAFHRALELGVYGIELDVHLSADGVPVVIHDDTVDRTTKGSGAVKDLTATELRKLDAGNGAVVPTLSEVLDLVGNEVHVDIEVKANLAGAAVLDEVRDRDTRWLISSFDWDVLRFVRSQDPDAELWPLTYGASEDALAVARELGSTTLAISHAGLDDDIVTMLKREELGFWVWTVNEPGRAQTCVEWGAVGICTDDPRMIQEAI